MDLDLSKAEDTQQGQNKPAIALPLLALINQARNEHGMRQQDFQRYRQFCTTKVHRLREALQKTHTQANQGKNAANKKNTGKSGVNKGLTKKAKRKAQSAAMQSEQNKGTGNLFVRRSIAVHEVQNDRPVQLLLFEAERAWSYSQELKQASFENEQDGALRRHGLARVRRAVQWSQQMLSLLTALGTERVDVLSRAQASAYHALLQGYEAFDKDKHEQSLKVLSVARKLFYLIAEASNDSRTEALANSYVDSTEPMLRYCAYNLEHPEQDMDKLANSVATKEVSESVIKDFTELEAELKTNATSVAADESKDGRLDEVVWRTKRIPIRNPDLVEVMTRVRAAEDSLRRSFASKEGLQAEAKAPSGKDHKRQRLTSAQRSAKKRGQASVAATTSASSGGATFKNATSGTSSSSKTEMDGYDSLLAALTEAEDVARKLVQDNAEALSKSHSGRYEAASTALTDAHEYVLFKLLAARTERNAALMEEVQVKSDKRQARVRESVASRLNASSRASAAHKQGGADRVRRRVKSSPRKVRPAKQAPKKSKTSKSKYSVGTGQRNRSQVNKKKKKSPRAKVLEEQLRQRGELKSRRIAARIIPGLAKLLDNNELSCSGIGGLALVESDSNLSTLIEAKSAWYKAELLRLLARSFAWADESDKSLVLLTRADLFVREARSAMELVELDEAVEEDKLLPPRMTEGTFTRSTEQVASFRLQVQRDVYARQLGAAPTAALKRISDAQSKAAQALRDMAAKYVDFDPQDLQQATVLSSDLQTRFSNELTSALGSVPASRRPSAAPAKPIAASSSPEPVVGETPYEPTVPAVAATTKSDESASEAAAIPSSPASDVRQPQIDQDTPSQGYEEGGPYDPANILAEEEEREAAEAAATKRGWLGGWFAGRKQ